MNGFKTKYSLSAVAGLTPQQSLGNHQEASLLRLDIGYGLPVLVRLPEISYTITRYNHKARIMRGGLATGRVALARVR